MGKSREVADVRERFQSAFPAGIARDEHLLMTQDRIVALNEIEELLFDLVHRPAKSIGILTADNGDYNVYVSFWDDAKALERGVKALKANRLNEYGDESDASVEEPEIRHVPDNPESDEFLDVLVRDIEDATGIVIETAMQAADRIAEGLEQAAADEEEAKPHPPRHRASWSFRRD